MKSINNILMFLYENWGQICIFFLLIFGIVMKTTRFLKKSEEEKIEYAKLQIKNTIMKWVERAEMEYRDKEGHFGLVKRAIVLEQVFKEYPILEKVTDKETLLELLDDLIDEAVIDLEEILDPYEEIQNEY